MIKELRTAFPYHKVVKIIKADTGRKAVYRIVMAGSLTGSIPMEYARTLEALGWDWELVGQHIHVRKSN